MGVSKGKSYFPQVNTLYTPFPLFSSSFKFSEAPPPFASSANKKKLRQKQMVPNIYNGYSSENHLCLANLTGIIHALPSLNAERTMAMELVSSQKTQVLLNFIITELKAGNSI